MIFVIAIFAAIVILVIGYALLGRRRSTSRHRMPADIKPWPPLAAHDQPKHFTDETAEFTAIAPGRHATDTAWAMPAVKPDVPRA